MKLTFHLSSICVHKFFCRQDVGILSTYGRGRSQATLTRFWLFFDHLLPSVGINVEKKSRFLDYLYLPPSSCKRSLWTTPSVDTVREFHISECRNYQWRALWDGPILYIFQLLVLDRFLITYTHLETRTASGFFDCSLKSSQIAIWRSPKLGFSSV